MDAATQIRIRQRAGHRCEYCLAPEELSALSFHVEHITARQHGGGGHDENLALSCPDCNWSKGPNLTSLDPDTGEITPLFHPRRQQWKDHFSVQEVLIIGITKAGRTTAWLLDMNNDERQHYRRWLIKLRQWPPTWGLPI